MMILFIYVAFFQAWFKFFSPNFSWFLTIDYVLQVETAKDSAPFLSLLSPLSSGSRQLYWKAPPTVTSVDFVIVLGTLSDVSGVILLVSPCGYSVTDAPTVSAPAPSRQLDQGVDKWCIYVLQCARACVKALYH